MTTGAALCWTADLFLKKEMAIFIDALTAIFSLLYPLWPLIPLVAVRRLFSRDHSFSQRIRWFFLDSFLGWLMWAFFWGFVIWQERQPLFFLPQRVNLPGFLMLGAVSGSISLFWLILIWREKHVRLSRIKKLADMQALTPEAFEALVAKLFKANGHQVELTGGIADHGIDIVVKNAAGEKWIVQCKRYSGSVGEPLVRDLYGTMLHEEAQGAYLMTTGTFTRQAQEWAEGKPMILYDGEALVELIKKVQSRD